MSSRCELFPVEMGEFLRELRRVTPCGVLLIFTGDRLPPELRQRQQHFGTPDIATYGKIMGGGFPAGAIAGAPVRSSRSSPAGPVAGHEEKL
jgi:glutamate-1-semialdehyde aminotransferase